VGVLVVRVLPEMEFAKFLIERKIWENMFLYLLLLLHFFFIMGPFEDRIFGR
jgi:hypothetical protein